MEMRTNRTKDEKNCVKWKNEENDDDDEDDGHRKTWKNKRTYSRDLCVYSLGNE